MREEAEGGVRGEEEEGREKGGRGGGKSREREGKGRIFHQPVSSQA